jgi:hypothetical protein
VLVLAVLWGSRTWSKCSKPAASQKTATNSECQMKKKPIPDDVKEEALRTIDRFNKTKLKGTERAFAARFQGKFLYLERKDLERIDLPLDLPQLPLILGVAQFLASTLRCDVIFQLAPQDSRVMSGQG